MHTCVRDDAVTLLPRLAIVRIVSSRGKGFAVQIKCFGFVVGRARDMCAWPLTEHVSHAIYCSMYL